MPEASLASNHTAFRGCAWYEFVDGLKINDFNPMQFGRTTSKTGSERWGIVAELAPSAIPLGDVTVNDAKLVMRASHSEAGAFDANFAFLEHNTKFDIIEDHVFHNGLMIYTPRAAAPGLQSGWALGAGSGGDSVLGQTAGGETGCWRIGQSWTYNGAFPSDLMTYHHFNGISRTNTFGAGTITINLYDSTGAAGSRLPTGSPLDTVGPLNIDATIGVTPTNWIPLLSVAQTLTPGNSYFTEMLIEGASGNGILQNQINTVGDGSTDNYAAFKTTDNMVGFPRRAIWERGDDLHSLAAVSTADAGIAIPDFTAGALYDFGTAGYLPDVAVPNLADGLQEALRARTSLDHNIVVRIHGENTTGSAFRRVNAQHEPTETINGLNGVVLVFDYTLPPSEIRSRGLLARDRVQSGRLETRSRVVGEIDSLQRVDAASLDTRARIDGALTGGPRIRARLTTRGN